MPLSEPITPGVVDWTGENPGILLKNDDDSFSAMALFFRVAWSPVGQGQVLLLLGSPNESIDKAEAPNIILSDNDELSRYLLGNFIGRLAAFRDAPAFKGVRHLMAQSIVSSGDPMSHRYSETVTGDGYCIELVWEELESPRALELMPDQVGSGIHTMFTVLVPAQQAQILVNGKSLPGKLGTRVQAGYETTSAFLYFTETWIIPPN
ncbi:MAG: hypothetical protein ACI845_002546 [Gammaproteobacteria bacterium]|jgi:hypothetical protein